MMFYHFSATFPTAYLIMSIFVSKFKLDAKFWVLKLDVLRKRPDASLELLASLQLKILRHLSTIKHELFIKQRLISKQNLIITYPHTHII